MKVYLGRFPKNGKERKISIRIDKWDSWNADNTIALIAKPLLISLKEDKQGAPLVDDVDVPDELKSTAAEPKENEWDTDSNHFKRWDWVLDEMIFAMSQLADNKGDSEFYDHSQVDETADFQTQLSQIKVDEVGLRKYHERLQRGCELFGKYFQCLWS